MYGYIYKTTCLITKLIYVGQHKAEKFEPNRYIGSGRRFKKALQEFGKDNFTCELIDTAESLDELNSKEEYWVEFYQSRDPLIGYNVKKGGEQLGLTGCCKIKRGEETMVVERASVKPYLDDGWVLTNTKEIRNAKSSIKNKKYYQEHKEQLNARNKLWRETNRERMKELKAKWTKEHPDYLKEKRRRHYQRHKDKTIAYQKEWLKKNPNYSHEYYLAHRDKYIERAKKSRTKNKLKNK